MGADVCVTGSNEHTLMMTFPGDAMFSVAVHGLDVSHTTLQKFGYSIYWYGPVKKHARVSASEIRVDSIKSRQNMNVFSLDPLATVF